MKGLHYIKYIGLELVAPDVFSLAFHKFYSHEVKDVVKSVPECRYDPDYRAWLLNTTSYDKVMVALKDICQDNKIHIEDIPQVSENCLMFVVHDQSDEDGDAVRAVAAVLSWRHHD